MSLILTDLNIEGHARDMLGWRRHASDEQFVDWVGEALQRAADDAESNTLCRIFYRLAVARNAGEPLLDWDQVLTMIEREFEDNGRRTDKR